MTDRLIKRPIFLVSSPRSGSSLLFLTLARSPDVHTIGGESHALLESIPGLHPRSLGWTSNRLDRTNATPFVRSEVSRRLFAAMRDRDGRAPRGPAVLLEKTPKNALRIPFFDAIYRDARFLYLYRDPRETLSSMIEAWSSGSFRTYPQLPGWRGTPWSLLLVPGWRDLAQLPLADIVAHQWAATTTILLDDLEAIADDRIVSTDYADIVATPQHSVATLCAGLGIGWDVALGDSLPLSPTVVSQPKPDKWRDNAVEIERVWPIVAAVDARARAALRRYRPLK